MGNGINFPVDARIDVLDDESDLSLYYMLLAKPAVNPAGILCPDFASVVASLIGGAIIGEIREYSLSDVPDGWMRCDGSAISRTSAYGVLLVADGCPFGVGDGSTTVNIPNRSGRVSVGVGSVPDGGDTVALGSTGGAGKVGLTVDEGPQHNHEYTWPGDSDYDVGSTSGNGAFTNALPPTGGRYTPYSGSGTPHENQMPYLGDYHIVFVGFE